MTQAKNRSVSKRRTSERKGVVKGTGVDSVSPRALVERALKKLQSALDSEEKLTKETVAILIQLLSLQRDLEDVEQAPTEIQLIWNTDEDSSDDL